MNRKESHRHIYFGFQFPISVQDFDYVYIF